MSLILRILTNVKDESGNEPSKDLYMDLTKTDSKGGLGKVFYSIPRKKFVGDAFAIDEANKTVKVKSVPDLISLAEAFKTGLRDEKNNIVIAANSSKYHIILALIAVNTTTELKARIAAIAALREHYGVATHTLLGGDSEKVNKELDMLWKKYNPELKITVADTSVPFIERTTETTASDAKPEASSSSKESLTRSDSESATNTEGSSPDARRDSTVDLNVTFTPHHTPPVSPAGKHLSPLSILKTPLAPPSQPTSTPTLSPLDKFANVADAAIAKSATRAPAFSPLTPPESKTSAPIPSAASAPAVSVSSAPIPPTVAIPPMPAAKSTPVLSSATPAVSAGTIPPLTKTPASASAPVSLTILETAASPVSVPAVTPLPVAAAAPKKLASTTPPPPPPSRFTARPKSITPDPHSAAAAAAAGAPLSSPTNSSRVKRKASTDSAPPVASLAVSSAALAPLSATVPIPLIPVLSSSASTLNSLASPSPSSASQPAKKPYRVLTEQDPEFPHHRALKALLATESSSSSSSLLPTRRDEREESEIDPEDTSSSLNALLEAETSAAPLRTKVSDLDPSVESILNSLSAFDTVNTELKMLKEIQLNRFSSELGNLDLEELTTLSQHMDKLQHEKIKDPRFDIVRKERIYPGSGNTATWVKMRHAVKDELIRQFHNRHAPPRIHGGKIKISETLYDSQFELLNQHSGRFFTHIGDTKSAKKFAAMYEPAQVSLHKKR
jgi:hypothetical protein